MIRGGGAGPGRRAALGLLLGCALAVGGCASLFGGSTAPSGLHVADQRLRSQLAAGLADSALATLTGGDAGWVGDELLRLQYEGLAAHYAGRWEESSRALERAHSLAEDRYTKSVSRAVLSMLASDRVLAYDPPRPERLFLHYYGALNYLRRDEPDEAAVEARRLGQLLERALEEEDGTVPPDLGRAMSVFAGAVFQAAGQSNDAAVSYRRARAFGERSDGAAAGAAGGGETDAGPWDPPPDRDQGRAEGATARVLVVLERGYVAHKVERDLTLFLLPREVERLHRIRRAAEADTARADPADLLGLAERVSARSFGGGSRRVLGRRARGGVDLGDAVLVRIAWPEFRDSPDREGPAGLRVDGAAVEGPRLRADVSRAVREAAESDRVLTIAKSLLRAAAKISIAKGLQEAASEEDETLGEVVGVAAQVAGALLERADTRSWHLLPDELALYPLRLPPGTHDLEALLAAEGEGVSLEPVRVEAGQVRVVTGRYWR